LPTGRRYGRLRGSGLSDATALARCGPCGARASNQMLRRAISTAKRTVTRGGNKRPLTRETRLENPARLQAGLANSGPRVTTADVYPASLCGVSDRRRRPRATMDFRALPPQRRRGIGRSHAGPDTRFGKRRSDRFAIFRQPLQLLGETYRSFHLGFAFRLRQPKDWRRRRCRW
jgi:hypothetical protein